MVSSKLGNSRVACSITAVADARWNPDSRARAPFVCAPWRLALDAALPQGLRFASAAPGAAGSDVPEGSAGAAKDRQGERP